MKKSLYSALLLSFLAFASVASAQIQLNFSSVQPTCHNDTNGSATVFAVGGNGSYTYAWGNGQTTQTIQGIGAGLYMVTVTDALQQTNSGTVDVVQPAAVSVAITAADIPCDGKNGMLTASGFGGSSPYTYAWEGPGGPSASASIMVTAPGNYSITITDANGCTGSNSYLVATALSLNVAATDILCASNPNSGALTTTVSGGSMPYVYSWSNGVHTPGQDNVGAGLYYCTVTSANGCVAVDSAFVNIPAALTTNLTWSTPACGGNNNGTAIVAATGGVAPYVFTWTPGALNGASQTGLAPGTYTVHTKDSNNCQDELNVVIAATNGLDVQLVVTSATCKGIDNATATAVVSPPGSGYVYEWNILPGVNVTQVTDLAVGTLVSVTVTDPTSGCSGTATAIVGEHNPIHIALTSINVPCDGDFGSATATASNGVPQYTYTWFNGNGIEIGNQPAIDSLLPGAYLVAVMDSIGCMAQDVVDISIVSAPNAVIDGGAVLVCGDSLSTVQFTNLSTDIYDVITMVTWVVNGPSVDTIIQQQNQIVFQLPVDETITVKLIVKSSHGCLDSTTLIYNVPGYPNISLSLDSSSLNCIGGPVSLNIVGADSSYTYAWAPSVTLNPNPIHVLAMPTDTATIFTVTVTDGNACTSFASIEIQASDDLLQLVLSDSIIQTCEAFATVSASTNVPSTIVWTDANGTVIPGNPITVPATPNTAIYTATATTADSCILVDQVSITGYGIDLSLDGSLDSVLCAGEPLALSVIATPNVPGLIYQWSVNAPATLSDPQAEHPILTGPVGNYIVKVVVTNVICSDSIEFPIQIKDTINLYDYITANLCHGLTASFFNPSGMPGRWSFGDGSPLSTEANPVHAYETPGQFAVNFTPTLLDCIAPWDTMISVYPDTLRADIVQMYVDCSLKAIIQFNGLSNHMPILAWDWSFSNGSPATANVQDPMITYTQEGEYVAVLTVTDKNHCTTTATQAVKVDIQLDEVAENLSICAGDSIQLNPIGIDPLAAYVWTAVPPDATLEANEPNPTVNPSVPTVYTVEIEKGLCKVIYTLHLNFKDGSNISLPQDTLIVCNTDSISITAQSTGSPGYEWSNSVNFTNIFATTQTVQVVPTGTFYVRTSGVACSALDSIRVELKSPEIQIVPTDNNICLGEETALILTNLIPEQTLSYNWNPSLPNLPNPIVSPTETTTYAVTVTNEFGCTASVVFPTIKVTDVSVDATATPDQVSYGNPNSTLLATPGGNGIVVSYSWTPISTLSDPNAPETNATPVETTTYLVTVTTEDGCIATDTVTLRFLDSPCASPYVFVPKAFTPNNDDKNDFFIVKADGMTALKMIIWNRWGEIVYETNDPNAIGWDGTFKGKNATPDAYAWYVVLTCGNGDVYESKGNVSLLK